MAIDKKLTLSLIIPVYNEEDYIGSCLEAIARQTEMPDEVIVVNNNSSDNTLKIVKKYKFVTVIDEPRQHQSFAQKRGFDTATSDIIGRIDGDTILPRDWVANVKAAFADEQVVAVNGDGNPYDMYAMTLGKIGFGALHWVAGFLAGTPMLWGANCALRRTAWQRIRSQVFTRTDIWEDHDMSYCLARYGRLLRIKNITVGFSLRSTAKTFADQFRYQFRFIRTVYLRRDLLRATITFMVWSLTVLLFPLLMLDHLILKPIASRMGRKFGPKAYLNGR